MPLTTAGFCSRHRSSNYSTSCSKAPQPPPHLPHPPTSPPPTPTLSISRPTSNEQRFKIPFSQPRQHVRRILDDDKDIPDIVVQLLLWHNLLDMKAICRAALVCNSWKELAYSRSNFSEDLDFTSFKKTLTTKQFKLIIEKRVQLRGPKKLRSLNIQGCCGISSSVVLELLKQTNISSLSIGGCAYYQKNNPIGDRRCNCSNVSDWFVTDLIPHCHMFRSLDISASKYGQTISREAINKLIQYGDLRRLKVLCLSRVMIYDDLLRMLARKCPTLRGIRLTNCPAPMLETVIDMVRHCPRLESYPPRGPGAALKVQNNPQGVSKLRSVVPDFSHSNFLRLWGILH